MEFVESGQSSKPSTTLRRQELAARKSRAPQLHGGSNMPKKPTVIGADLILKLYDLRREPEIRKARNWWLTQFWPESADDILKISNSLGSQENNWMRQVGGYWEMAASLALRGAIDTELFLEPSFSGE